MSTVVGDNVHESRLNEWAGDVYMDEGMKQVLRDDYCLECE